MTTYTKISLWYLVCIAVGLGAAYAEGVPAHALMKAGLVSVFVVIGIFIGMLFRERHGKH